MSCCAPYSQFQAAEMTPQNQLGKYNLRTQRFDLFSQVVAFAPQKATRRARNNRSNSDLKSMTRLCHRQRCFSICGTLSLNLFRRNAFPKCSKQIVSYSRLTDPGVLCLRRHAHAQTVSCFRAFKFLISSERIFHVQFSRVCFFEIEC